MLRLLATTTVPAAELVAVDPDGAECADPSLLMTRLPGGRTDLTSAEVAARLERYLHALL